MRDALARFESHYLPEPNTGCWLWTGYRDQNGYGKFGYRGKATFAHRWLYEHLHGQLPKTMVLDHLCRTPACVNPEHLEPVTQKINLHRGRGNARKTHCKRGHPLSGQNLYRYRGARQCRICRYVRDQQRHRD